MFFSAIAPYLAATGDALVNLDENKSGADDFAGELLIYAADVITAVSNQSDLPDLPEVLAAGTLDRITGYSRVSLIVISSILTVAQFQVTGKAATALRYANQAIRLLLAGRPVPPAPAELGRAA